MKKHIQHIQHIAIAAGLLLTTAGAMAQVKPQLPGNMYLGIAAGETNHSLPNGLGLFPNKSSDNTYNLSIGNYFANNLGAELAYNDFGNLDRAGGTTKATGLSLSLIGRLPVANSVNLLGRIGTTYGSTSVSASPASGVASGDKQGFGMSYGVGAEYVFTPAFSVSLQYDNYALGFAGDRTDNIGATTIGLRIRY